MRIDFKSRGFLIPISIFFAVIFWAFVMADGNTTRVEDVRGVPVYFSGAEDFVEKGLVLTERSKETATVRIEGGVNVVSYITVNNISAYIDMTSITEAGEYELPVSAFCNNGSVIVKSVSPSKIKVTVEKYIEKQVPVEIVYDKNIPEGYWIDNANAQTERVTVGGGQSEVQKVTKAVVNVSTDAVLQAYTDNADGVYEASLPVIYVDGNGETIQGLNAHSTIVTVNVLGRKTVKVDAQGAIEGSPGDGFKVDGISQSIEEIDIVGKRDVLEKIESLSVEAVNIDGATARVVSDVNLKPIDGVAFIGNSTVKVTVDITKSTE